MREYKQMPSFDAKTKLNLAFKFFTFLSFLILINRAFQPVEGSTIRSRRHFPNFKQIPQSPSQNADVANTQIKQIATNPSVTGYYLINYFDNYIWL